MFEVSDISKWFGGNAVLNNVSFKVRPGEVVGLIGPNGAGKTTLFNVVSGFYRTKTGFIRFNDTDITSLAPEAICNLGLCRTFQITKPFSNISVLKNVMIGALAREKTLKGRKEGGGGTRFRRPLRAQESPREESDDRDRKRLEIARGLATSPKLFLLDEVMAGLTRCISRRLSGY